MCWILPEKKRSIKYIGPRPSPCRAPFQALVGKHAAGFFRALTNGVLAQISHSSMPWQGKSGADGRGLRQPQRFASDVGAVVYAVPADAMHRLVGMVECLAEVRRQSRHP